MKRRKNSVRLFVLSSLFLLFSAADAVYSETVSSDLAPVLYDAAGISESDIKAAAEKKTVSLFDLYVFAVSQTERMAIEGENGVQAKAHRSQALGLFLPQVSLNAAKAYPTPPANQSSFAPKAYVALYAQENIISGLKEISQYRKAGAEMKMREYSLRNSAGQLLLDVATSYFNVIRLGRSLANKEKVLGNYRGIASELEKRVSLGRSRQSELLQIQSQIYTILAQIESLQNSLRQARNDLSVLTGASADVPLSDILPSSEPSCLDKDPSACLGSRYDIRAADAQAEMARAGLIAAYGGFAPDLSIIAGDRLYQPTMNGHDYYVQFSAVMPLFSGGTTVAAINEAQSLVRQAELTKLQTRRQAVQQISDAVTNYKSTKHQIDSYKKALDQAESNYVTLLGEYRLKLVSILDVFSALTNLETARDNYEGIIISHELSRIALGVTTGEMTGPGVSVLRPSETQGASK